MIELFKVSAPAKAILCGQHAVVYGQDAIAFAVDLKCHANVFKYKQFHEPNSIDVKVNISNQVKSFRFNSQVLSLISSIPKTVTKVQIQNFQLNEVDLSFEEFTHKIQTHDKLLDQISLTTLYKIVLFCQIFAINPSNLSQFLHNHHFFIQTSSQIPIGKGLGSSASFNSILAASLLVVMRILKKQQIQADSGYKGIVNYLSKTFQKVQHGRPSGIDNFVSIYGGMVLFNKTKNPPFKLIDNPKILTYLSSNLSICFVDSGIEKNTKLAVSKVLEKYNLHLQGEPKYKRMIEEIGQFPNRIIQLIGDLTASQTQIRQKFFEILKLNHSYLKELGLSNKEIEQIVQKYTVEGKSVAKITGAGMGGVVLIVGDKAFLSQAQSQQSRQSFASKMNTYGLEIEFL